MRVVQPEGARGSLKWLQRAVNRRPDLLAHRSLGQVEWLSPLASDDYAEYRDRSFLRLVGLDRLANDLAAFWPARGPQWDALGTAGDLVVLVEAKAHLREMLSPPSAAGAASLARIEKALEAAKAALGATGEARWTQVYYQLANRIAHLHFLRDRGVDARLLLVGFVGDDDVGGPASAAEWDDAYRVAFGTLGLHERHSLSPFIHHMHPDVAALENA